MKRAECLILAFLYLSTQTYLSTACIYKINNIQTRVSEKNAHLHHVKNLSIHYI